MPGRENKAELILVDGVIVSINYINAHGKTPLSSTELAHFKEIVAAKSSDIVQKWIDYFVLHKIVNAERIDRRIK
jgi:hypothetical protein